MSGPATPSISQRLRVYAYELVKTFGLFSVLPVLRVGQALRDEGRAEWYTYSINLTQYFALPLVGAVKLALALALGWAAAAPWGPGIGAALAVIAYVGLSGGMHLDGFADTMDALFAAGTKDARVVLRDPHVGALGVVYLILYLALTGVFAGLAVWAWLTAPSAALTGALLLVAVSPRLLCHGLVAVSFGRGFENDRLVQVIPPYPWWPRGSRRLPATLAWWALQLAAILGLAGGAAELWLLLALGAAANLGLALYTLRRRVLPTLGFINGDVLGFTICLSELAHWVLVALLFVRV